MILPSLMLWAAPAPPIVEQDARPATVEPIMVVGRRGAPPRVVPDAVEVLRTFCFEPARTTGRFAPPAADPRWIELDDKARRQFHVEDAAGPAWALDDETRGQQLWLKVEELARPEDLIERRCTLLVIGGGDHRRFVGQITKLFHGVPTQGHVGVADGAPAVAGWEQWLWTGMPPRGSKSWEQLPHPRGAAPTWLVVSDSRRFYDAYDFIMADMKLRKGPVTPVTMLTFSVTSRRPSGARGAR
jgi:hypothetical protein